MPMRTRQSLPTLALLAALAAPASAQLIVGTTSSVAGNVSAFYLDLNTSQLTNLWVTASNKKVNGLAADPFTGRLYCNDAARLNFWNYGSIGTVPTFIAGMYRTSDNITFTPTGVDGLAFAHGRLYGVTSFGSTIYKRGIYEVATVSDGMATPHCVMTPLWLDPTGIGTVSGTFATGGLEFNTANNLFYMTNSADTTGSGGNYTPGVYTCDAFGAGTLTKLTDFPVGHTRIDGLAIGQGKLWMTEQDPTTSAINIFPYDLATNTYGTMLTIPLPDGTNRASGAAWAPGALHTFCLADLNYDGTHNTADLLILLGGFGSQTDPGTNGDINGDGSVTTADLLLLLGVFGNGC